MSYRKKHPLPLNLNLHSHPLPHLPSNMTRPAQYSSTSATHTFVPPNHQSTAATDTATATQATSINPHPLDHFSSTFDTNTITSSGCPQNHVTSLDKNAFTTPSNRPKPLLSNTFGYSSHPRSIDPQTDAYVPNADLASLFLSISPTSIAHTCRTTSPSSSFPSPSPSPFTPFPLNHHDPHRHPPAPTLFRTKSGPIHESSYYSAKDINILKFIATQRHNQIPHSVPVTPSSITSGVSSDHSSASLLSFSAVSTSTVATSFHRAECDETPSTGQPTATTPASPSANHTPYGHMESSYSTSRLTDLNSLTPSSSFASTLSLASVSDQNMKFRPQDLSTSWPVPPSSSSKSPATFDGPRKAASYYPLRRNLLFRPSDPYPLSFMKPQSASTLAYLDLSSAPPLPPQPVWPHHDKTILTSEPICYDTTPPNFSPAGKRHRLPAKPGSSAKQKPRSSRPSIDSDITEGTVYQDAQEKAEWMEVDNGDAYDDLEKTEASVRRISQSLTMMNGLGAFNRPVKRPLRRLARPSKVPSHGSASNISVLPLPPSRQNSAPVPRAERSVNVSRLWSTPPLTSGHRLDENHSPLRLRNEAEPSTMGGVPLFTRSILARDDREEDRPPLKNSRIDPLQRADDDVWRFILKRLEPKNAELIGSSKSGLLPSSGHPRRRLKPLILRPVVPSITPTRTRATTPSSKFLSIESTIDGSLENSANPSRLVSRSDLSPVSNGSMPTLSCGEAPSSPRHRISLSSEEAVSAAVERPPSDTYSHEGRLSGSIISMTDSSPNCRDSGSEAYATTGSHDQRDSEASPSQPTRDNAAQLSGKSPRVSFATNTRTMTGSSYETPMAGGLRKYESHSHLDLPTLAAGSLKTERPHPTSTKPQIWSSQRKRNISNLFVSRQALADGGKKSFDSSSFRKSPESSSSPRDAPSNDSSTTAKGKKSVSWSRNRLALTLSRMEAQDGKLLDLRLLNKRTSRDVSSSSSLRGSSNGAGHVSGASSGGNGARVKDEKRIVIKGKVKRISQPILLGGEEERHALWGMISTGKPSDHHHHHHHHHR